MSDINGQTDYRDKPGTDSAYTGSGAAYAPRDYRKPGVTNPKNDVAFGTVSGQMGAQKPGTSSAGGVLSGGTIVGGTTGGAQKPGTSSAGGVLSGGTIVGGTSGGTQKPGTSSAGGVLSGGTINGQSVIPQKAAADSGALSYQSYVPTKADSGTVTAQMQGSMKPGSTVPTGTTGTGSAGSQPEAAAANTRSYADLIYQQYDAMNQQQALNIDYKTQTAVDQSVWGYQDQLPDIQSAYRNNTTQMYQGMDNAALNARANGQYGGTATEKVGAIQSQYQQARNELAIKQRKLADDTINQINVLRRNGEYEKADALLKSAQQELDALYRDAIRVDENQYSNWQYQTSIDREDAAIQREQEANDRDYTRQIGMMLLQYGIVPDDDMLSVMGIDKTTAQAYATYMKTYGR